MIVYTDIHGGAIVSQLKIMVVSSFGEEQLPLEITYERDTEGYENKLILSTAYQGKTISAVGIHYPFEDAFSDLQNKLPKGVLIKACVSCRHGNMCPVGNELNEVFCTKDVEITRPQDLWPYTENPHERVMRSRKFNDCCPDFSVQSKAYYSYNDWLHYLTEESKSDLCLIPVLQELNAKERKR